MKQKTKTYTMENYNAGREFREVVEGHNFMTPQVIEYFSIKDGVCELSTGKSSYSYLFGVTVVRGWKNCLELGKCLLSEKEALEYIETLK